MFRSPLLMESSWSSMEHSLDWIMAQPIIQDVCD